MTFKALLFVFFLWEHKTFWVPRKFRQTNNATETVFCCLSSFNTPVMLLPAAWNVLVCLPFVICHTLPFSFRHFFLSKKSNLFGLSLCVCVFWIGVSIQKTLFFFFTLVQTDLLNKITDGERNCENMLHVFCQIFIFTDFRNGTISVEPRSACLVERVFWVKCKHFIWWWKMWQVGADEWSFWATGGLNWFLLLVCCSFRHFCALLVEA